MSTAGPISFTAQHTPPPDHIETSADAVARPAVLLAWPEPAGSGVSWSQPRVPEVVTPDT